MGGAADVDHSEAITKTMAITVSTALTATSGTSTGVTSGGTIIMGATLIIPAGRHFYSVSRIPTTAGSRGQNPKLSPSGGCAKLGNHVRNIAHQYEFYRQRDRAD